MAGRIPQHFIDDLLARVDIVDVISSRLQMKRAGANYKACCPFHGEKTPSFTVSQTKQFYHCFGCGANGSAISFLMEFDGMHFVDAIETLAEIAGVEVPREQSLNIKLPGNAGPQTDNRPLYQLLDQVAAHYVDALKDNERAIAYLKNRGLSGETAKRFKVGYANDGYDNLDQAFKSKEKALESTGMLVRNDRGNTYARFRDRIMFPIRDRRGRIIAFGGRVLDKQEPKYLNSPETPLFHKSRELYGLFEGRRDAQDAGFALVVEGYMDVVALAEVGICNAFATLGTSPNQSHCETLLRMVPGIVFCFDGDRAGRAAAWRAAQAALPCLRDGRDAHFLFLPDGEDPDSIVKTGGAAGMIKLLEDKVPIVDYLFEHLSQDINIEEVGGKAALAEKMKPQLANMPEGVYRDLSLQKLEQIVGFPVGLKASGAAGNAPAQEARTPREKYQQSADKTQNPARLSLMRRTVVLLLNYPFVAKLYDPGTHHISADLNGAPLLLSLLKVCHENKNMATGALMEHFRETEHASVLERLVVMEYMPDGSILEHEQAEEEFSHCLQQLHAKGTHDAVTKVQPSQRTGLLSVSRGNKR